MFACIASITCVRRCGRCGQHKAISEFAWRRKHLGQRDNYCRRCRAAYKQEHYATNRARYVESAVRRKRRVGTENAHRLLEYLGAHPCLDCGETDPLVLEFDHVDNKSFSIATALRDRSWKVIEEEIKRCEVVCANCHRRRTARRGRFLRVAVLERLATPEGDSSD